MCDLEMVLEEAITKIGREEIFQMTIGKYSKHATTHENGQLLANFAKEKNMIIYYLFRARTSKEGTFTREHGYNQMGPM